MFATRHRRSGIAARACSFVAALTLAAASLTAAHAQHDQHTGHATPKPSAPARKAEKKPAARPRQRQTPAPTPATARPAATPEPQQQPGQHQHHVETPRATPTPDAQTVAEPSPAEPAATPAAQPTPGAGKGVVDHSQHGVASPRPDEKTAPSSATTPAATTTTTTPAAAPVDHSAHGGPTGGEEHELSGMSGNLYGIRVGRSESNVMPMGQMGSGTTWQPASSPTHMWHKNAGPWMLMLHGEAKLGVNRQGGPRGVTKFESQNWLMPMALRRVGNGTLQLRGMFSLEPLTFSGAGSPQLFQTGEVYQGQPIRDFQHPHDLFMELSATYTVPVGERGTWFAYLGFPGEPALGPVAFMHRASASENPTAPLGHHLQDSTHISFGVFTTGFTYRWLKVEGSLFNGREPDDRRYGFEFNPWTSRSLRVSVAPNANWTMQYSYGHLKNPEFFEPGDTHRQTASVQYNRPFARGNWATALIWGRNREQHGGHTFRLNSYLAESTVNFLDRNYLYTRLELVDREGDDLFTHEELHDLGFGEGAHPQFRVGAYTFGGAREIWNTERFSTAVGADATLYSKPDVLNPAYGHSPVSFKLFLRIRPGRSAHAGHGGN